MTPFSRARLAVAHLPTGMRDLAGLVLDKAEAAYLNFPDWPMLALPDRLSKAYALDKDRRDALLAGAILLYAAADVIDDAQDGDLDAADWGDPAWPRGVNVGNALVFAALGVFTAAAPGREARIAAHFADAGLRMTAGQHLDFGLVLSYRVPEEAAYLLCIEGKSGGSLGFFCRTVGIAAERTAEEADRLGELGEAIGAMMQIKSDIGDLVDGDLSRDLEEGRVTLPVIFALSGPHREAVEMAWRSRDRQALLPLLEASGAISYSRMRMMAYGQAAQAVAGALKLPEETLQSLDHLVRRLAAPAIRAPI